MKTWSLLPVLALAAAPITPDEHALEFRPAAGLALQRSWSIAQDLLTEELSMQIGEKVMPTEIRLRLTTREDVDVIDECLKVGEHGPLDYRRTFARLSRSIQMSDMASEERAPIEVGQASPLEGARARYQWQPSADTFGKYYEGEVEGPESALATFPDELGFVGLLPSAAVALESKWTVPAAQLGQIFAPFGTLPYSVTPGADKQLMRTVKSGIGGNLQELFAGQAQGDATVTFAAITQQEGGPRLARLELNMRIELTRDQTAFANRERTFDEKKNGLVHPSAKLVNTLSGNGVLLWDLDSQRADAFEFEGAQSLVQTIVSRYPEDPADGARKQTAVMTGTLVVQMATGPAVAAVGPPSGD
jgi:hypothetical protein